MGNTYTIRVRSGSNSVRRYRFSLWWKRYIFNPRSNGRGFYEKKIVPNGKKTKCSISAEEENCLLTRFQPSTPGAGITGMNFFQKLKQYPGDTSAQMWQCGMSTNPRRACESKLARIVCSEAHWQHEDCAGAGRTA